MKTFKWNAYLSNLILGILVIAFGTAILAVIKFQNYTIWGKGPGQGLFPMIAAGGIILCGISILLEAFLDRKRTAEGKETGNIILKSRELYNFCVVLGIAVLVVLLSEMFGFIPCVAAAMVLYIRLLGGERWSRSLLIGIGMGIVIYVIFVVFLKVHFPKGIIGI